MSAPPIGGPYVPDDAAWDKLCDQWDRDGAFDATSSAALHRMWPDASGIVEFAAYIFAREARRRAARRRQRVSRH